MVLYNGVLFYGMKSCHKGILTCNCFGVVVEYSLYFNMVGLCVGLRRHYASWVSSVLCQILTVAERILREDHNCLRPTSPLLIFVFEKMNESEPSKLLNPETLEMQLL